MSHDRSPDPRDDWTRELPVLTGPTVALREPVDHDLPALIDLLSTADATRFAIDEDDAEIAALRLLTRAREDRAKGAGFVYVVVPGDTGQVVGAFQVRALDPVFETAEWEATLLPSVRGTAIFIEAARLIGSFAFGTLGTNRLEARVLLQHGRANGALRKLGAVQEGVLRRAVRKNQAYFDQVLWSVLKDDWADHWRSTVARVH
jgi:RimJ/RimL family protein N-acetyltransferase